MHPDYKPPEEGPRRGMKSGKSGCVDKNEDVWSVDSGKQHYDVQEDKGNYRKVPIPGANGSGQEK